MEGIFASILGISCGHNGPKLTLTSIAFLITSQPHVVVWNIMSHVEAGSVLDVSDSNHSTFLLEDKSLIGSSSEMEHNTGAIVEEILSNVQTLCHSSVNGIDDVVLLWLEKRILSESHSIGVTLIDWGSHLMGIFNFVLPVVERLLLGLLSSIERFNDPDLITISFDGCLDNVLLIFFSSANTHHQTSMSLDQVSLISKRSIGNPGDFKPAAVMLASISDDLSIDIILVLEDAKSMSAFLISKGQLSSLRIHMEMLIRFVVVFCQNKLSFFVNCEDKILVQNRIDFVETLLVHINMGVNIGKFRFFRLFLWLLSSFLLLVFSLVFSTFLFLLNGFNPPELVITLMNVILQNLLSVFSLSSSNIKSSVAGMSLDKVSLVGPFSFLSSGKSEPAACMFSSVSHNLSSVVLLVLKDAKPTVVGSAHKGILVLFTVNVEDLTFVSTEGSNFDFVVLNTQTLFFIEDRDNFV